MTMSVWTTRCGSSMPLFDGLDLAAAGFGRVVPVDGTPGICAADLLKLYIYGYLNRVRSSRRLEAETRPQYRGDLAAAPLEAGLQDHR